MEATSLFFNKQLHILTRRLIFMQQYIIYTNTLDTISGLSLSEVLVSSSLQKFPSLPEGAKICGTCRRKTSNFCKEELTSTSESDNPEIVSKVFVLHSGLSRK